MLSADDHPSKVGWAGRLSRHVSKSTDRVAIATGISTAPCSTPYGDLVVRLAIQNRQDYVRLHSHEFHLMAQSVDPHLRMGAWQKLGFMQQVLEGLPCLFQTQANHSSAAFDILHLQAVQGNCLSIGRNKNDCTSKKPDGN